MNSYNHHSWITFFWFALTVLPFYDPAKDFTCLDGSLTVPFSNVNDDYCDCADGTDEPGTVFIINHSNPTPIVTMIEESDKHCSNISRDMFYSLFYCF